MRSICSRLFRMIKLNSAPPSSSTAIRVCFVDLRNYTRREVEGKKQKKTSLESKFKLVAVATSENRSIDLFPSLRLVFIAKKKVQPRKKQKKNIVDEQIKKREIVVGVEEVGREET